MTISSCSDLPTHIITPPSSLHFLLPSSVIRLCFLQHHCHDCTLIFLSSLPIQHFQTSPTHFILLVLRQNRCQLQIGDHIATHQHKVIQNVLISSHFSQSFAGTQ